MNKYLPLNGIKRFLKWVWMSCMVFLYLSLRGIVLGALKGIVLETSLAIQELRKKGEHQAIAGAALLLASILFCSVSHLHFARTEKMAVKTGHKIQRKAAKPTASTALTGITPKSLIKEYGAGALSGLVLVGDPGHAGKEPKASAGIDVGTSWVWTGERFYEAAYTYKMAAEVRRMVEILGGKVVYTASAPSMNETTGPRRPMPLPLGATLYDGSVLNNATDTIDRANNAGKIADDLRGSYRKIVFISLHVDYIGGGGWSGLRVAHPRNNNPEISQLIADALSNPKLGYGRRRWGKPVSCVKGINYDVLSYGNTIVNRVLLETGVPKDLTDKSKWSDADSWRLRNTANRQQMLQHVVIEPLVRFMKGGKR